MAKTRLKFDPDNFFVVGQHDTIERAKFMRDAIFPLAVAAYNAAEGQIRIGQIKYHENGPVSRVHLVSPTGLSVAYIDWQANGDIQMLHNRSPLASSVSAVRSLCTNNARYLMNKLSKSSLHDARLKLASDADRARTDRAYTNIVHDIVESVINKINGDRLSQARVDFGWNDDMPHILALYFAGEITKNDIPLNKLTDFETRYNRYVTKRDKFMQTMQGTVDFFTGDKWLLIDGINNGVILGAISGEPVVEAVQTMVKTGSLLTPHEHDYKYAKPVVPFTWYRSFEDIPDDLRSQVEISLVMLKSHTGRPELIPTVDGEPLTVYPDASALVREYHNEAKVVLLHK
jgi:hypothetical protein